MLELIRETIEYKEFGLNALTISAIATILFTFLRAYGVCEQAKEIYKNKSGEAIDTVFYFYNFFYYFIFFVLGIKENSLAIIINGSLSFIHIPVLLGLIKYKSFKKLDIIFILLMLIASSSVFYYPHKDQILFAFSCISLIVIIKQSKEFLRKRSLGNFSLKYLQVFFVTNLFWCIFFAATGQWLLEVACVIGTILYALILILQRKWKSEERKLKFEERIAPLSFHVIREARLKKK